MPDAMLPARTVASIQELDPWPRLNYGQRTAEAWNTFAIGFDDRLIVTSPVREPRQSDTPEADRDHPYPDRWSAIAIHERDGRDRWRSTEFEVEVYAPPRVQRRAGGGWLVQALSTHGDRLHAFDVLGDLEHTYPFGLHVAVFQATSENRMWVGYWEEAILGTGIGSAALAAYDSSGRRIFNLNEVAPSAGLQVPLNLNAINVVSEREVWALGTGPESILLKIDDLSIAQHWLWHNTVPDASDRGPSGNAIAVDGQHALIARDMDPQVTLLDLDTRQSRSLLLVDEAAHQRLNLERVQGRRERLWLVCDRVIYTVDLKAALAVSS